MGRMSDAQSGGQDRSLGRNTAIMAAGTAVSRALGMVRNFLLVAAIGVTASVAAESYAVANKLPNVMFAVLAAGVLNAALVPQIVKSFHEGRERTVHRILTIGTVTMLVTTAVLTLTASFWVSAYSGAWSADQIALATAFAWWCIPQLFFYGLYTLFGQVLNAKSQFGWFMWAPAAANVVAIGGLVAFLAFFGPMLGKDEPNVAAIVAAWEPIHVFLIAGCATLGIATQALILIVPMIKGGYRWRWAWRGPKGELSSVSRVALWALGAVLVEQMGVAAVTNITTAASHAAPQDPSVAGEAAYAYALGIMLVPHSLVSISLMTALFTTMAQKAAEADLNAVKAVMSQGVRLVGAFTVFAAVALAVLSPHATRVLIPPSESGDIVNTVAWVLSIMAFALIPLGASVMVKQVYFALEDGKTVFWIHFPMTIAWLGVAFTVKAFTEPQWWVRGVALGLVATNVTAFVLRLALLRKRLNGTDARRILTTYAKASTAAVPAGLVGLALTVWGPQSWRETGWSAWLVSAAWLAVSGVLMLAVYLAGAKVLRLTEATSVAASVASRLRRVR